jgi:hypothetical protein
VCFVLYPVILLQIHGCKDIMRHLLTAANFPTQMLVTKLRQLKCLLQSCYKALFNLFDVTIVGVSRPGGPWADE